MASSTTNLQDGGVEALKALLSSMPSSDGSGDTSKLSLEALQKLSDRLKSFVGDGSALQGTSEQPTNEEGLPIIEISEPVADTGDGSGAQATSIEEDPLVPSSALTEEELELRRRERDRILDELEEEEEQERVRTERRDMLAEQAEREKRKERVKEDLEKLKSAKAMQKKMGKALLRSLAEDRESSKSQGKKTEGTKGATDKHNKKLSKSVSFAEGTKPTDTWTSNRSLTQHTDSQPAIMQESVVERFSSPTDQPKPPTKPDPPVMQNRVFERGTSSASGVAQTTPPPHASSYRGDRYSDGDDSDGPLHLEKDYDSAEEELEYAQQQHELAMEYLQRKEKMGQEFIDAMANTGIQDPNWEQEDVPLDATLSRPPPKPSKSRFKANRPSQSIPNTMIPASSANTLEESIRFGRLEGDKLVGGPDGDSDDEQSNEQMHEMIELLRKGELHNIENIGPSIPTSTSTDLPAPPPPSKLSRYDPSKPKQFQPSRPKPSQDDSSTEVDSPPGSRPDTPPSNAPRSSPKLPGSPAPLGENHFVPGPSALRNPVQLPVTERSPMATLPAPAVLENNFIPRAIAPDVLERQPPRARAPPTVLSAGVKEAERGAGVQPPTREDTPQQKKVSKFMSGRS